MRILYIGSQPSNESSLQLQREITELQQRFAELTAQSLSFVPLSSSVEDLPRELARYAPDILHIASHGDTEDLRFAGPNPKLTYNVTPRALRAFLNYERPPQLVYLNACNSGPIAETLARSVPAVIGSTAPITNVAARRGAITFYERILAGLPIKRAFLAAREIVEAIEAASPDRPSMALFNRPDTDVSRVVLHPIPRLVAKLSEPSERHSVRFGISGCPAGTSFVAFFTDADGPEVGDCSVARGPPRGGWIWDPVVRDPATLLHSRICVAGMMLEQRSFSLSARLTEAFDNFYRRSSDDAMPLEVSLALRQSQTARVRPTLSL